MLATVSNNWTQWTHLASFITHNDSKLKTLVANAVITPIKAQLAEDSKQTQWMKTESGDEEFEREEGEELAMEEEEQAKEEEEFKSEEEEKQAEEEFKSEEEEKQAKEEEEFKSEEEEKQAKEEEEEANKGEEKVQEGEQDNLALSLRTRCEQQSLTMSLSMAWQWLKQD